MNTQNQTKNNDQPKKTAVRFSKWIFLAIAILGIAAVALAATALRGDISFKGRATFTPMDGNRVALQLDMAGIATHLGKSTMRIQSLADISGSGPTPIPPSTGVITAANGDTVSFTLRWTVLEVASGVFDVSGTINITGGTGRFIGATGSGNYKGWLNANNGTCAFDGIYELLR